MFAIGFLLGSMLGACLGFLTSAALRAGRLTDDAGQRRAVAISTPEWGIVEGSPAVLKIPPSSKS
jgi:hypothetical protein